MLDVEYIERDLKSYIDSISSDMLLNELERAGLKVYERTKRFTNDEIKIKFNSEQEHPPILLEVPVDEQKNIKK